MSNRAVTWAFEQDCGSMAAKLVLVKLADNANDDGLCWPSMDYVARHCNCTRNTVFRIIKKLQHRQLLDVHPRSRNGMQTSNEYSLRMPQSDRIKTAKAHYSKSSTKSAVTQLCDSAVSNEASTLYQPRRLRCNTAMIHEPSEETLIREPKRAKAQTGEKEPDGKLREREDALETLLSEAIGNTGGGAAGAAKGMTEEDEAARRALLKAQAAQLRAGV
jgi:hypothetical protein